MTWTVRGLPRERDVRSALMKYYITEADAAVPMLRTDLIAMTGDQQPGAMQQMIVERATHCCSGSTGFPSLVGARGYAQDGIHCC